MKQSEAYRSKLEGQMQELDAEVDKLKARARQAGAEQRIKYNEYLDVLDEKRETIKSKMSELKDDGEDALDELKAGMQDAWQRLAIAKKAAEAQFKA